jgi:photosystem II stability/assembly factor-like uncharacterized protein
MMAIARVLARAKRTRARILVCLGAAMTALVVLSAASGGVNTPYSGWYSGNPLLGANRLVDLACAGNTCYASGDSGTVLKSTDGGGTWTGIVTGLTVDLPRIRLAGGDEGKIVAGGGCAVRRSDDGGESFSRPPFAPSDTSCPFSVAALSFPSADVGYLLLNGGNVVSTTDGAQTFSRKTAVPGSAACAGRCVAPPDLLCRTETICFAATNGDGTVQRTTDGGGSWTRVATSGGPPLRGLEAVGTTLYAVGNNLTVLKSADGGDTWDRKPVTGTPPGNLTSVRCAEADTCLMTTESGNQVLRTTDGGETYESVAPSTDPIYAVEFASATRALAVGAQGTAAISDDAGANWRTVGSRISGSFLVLHAASDTAAYAGGSNGVLARTINAGQTWANVSAPTASTITGIAAPTADRVFVLASDGTVQRSNNGGVSYRLLSTGTTAKPRAITALNANTVLLVGPIGVRRSKDGGETFRASTAKAVRGAGLGATDDAGGTVVVYGSKAIAVSSDGGNTWRAVKRPRKQAIRDLDFVSPKVGFLLDQRGRLWKTTNAGRKWGQLNTTGASGYLIEFADARDGYLAIPGGFAQGPLVGIVLRTSDGGSTWRPQLLNREVIRTVESAGGTDYALAGESALFATKSRGDVGSPQTLSIRTQSRVLRKSARISVSGRLSPADGGETVVIARYVGGQWQRQNALVASNGSFATRWTVGSTAVFVAQVLGDADHAATGTKPLIVTVTPEKKVKKKRN